MFTSRPIGFVSSPYKNPSEVPKGLGAKHDADGVLKILPEFEAGLADIEGFSHLIVIWEFDRSQGFELTASPPSDNRTHGVFATRSPLRPNPIALTTIELLRRDGANLHVRGVDMLDGTPILDIKPYLSNIPSEKLRRGWLAEAAARQQTRISRSRRRMIRTRMLLRSDATAFLPTKDYLDRLTVCHPERSCRWRADDNAVEGPRVFFRRATAFQVTRPSCSVPILPQILQVSLGPWLSLPLFPFRNKIKVVNSGTSQTAQHWFKALLVL